MKACTMALSLVFVTSACGRPEPPTFPQGELVDLSHTYDAQTIYWPTAEGFRLRKDADGVTPAGYYYAANSLFTSEHGGTHIDAPIHFAQGAPSVDQIPLTRLMGQAVWTNDDVADALRTMPPPAQRTPGLRLGPSVSSAFSRAPRVWGRHVPPLSSQHPPGKKESGP